MILISSFVTNKQGLPKFLSDPWGGDQIQELFQDPCGGSPDDVVSILISIDDLLPVASEDLPFTETIFTE